MFLSRPAVLSGSQERESQRWTGAIEAAGLRVARIQRTGYEPDPWTQLRSKLEQVDGAIILGFRQLSVNGLWRADTPEEVAEVATWTSPWLQIEAGMALMQGLPVLVVPERNVSEGVFERRRWTGLLFGTEMEREPVGEPGNAWIDAVRRRSRTSAVGKFPDRQAS